MTFNVLKLISIALLCEVSQVLSSLFVTDVNKWLVLLSHHQHLFVE